MRPLGISSSDDKLVEEIVKMILESIYDPTFSNYSHGFRPGRSCHTALLQLQQNFTGVKWFVEGDIKSYFDTIDHHNLINNPAQEDKGRSIYRAYLEIFWGAGYMENWEYNATFSGIAQGSGISPILANIYLNEFDRFMEDYKKKFDRGTGRKRNNEYTRKQSHRQRCKNKIRKEWDGYSDAEKTGGITPACQS